MSTSVAARSDKHAGSFAKTLTLAAMSLGYAVVQLDVTVVNVAMNSVGASFGGSVASMQWIVTSYTIAFAALILTAGALGDRIGARRVFIAGFAVFIAASVACAAAPALPVLIAARVVQGIGAAILVPNSLALLNHAYPDEADRHRAVAIWATGASLALTAGPLVGGGLIALSGWRWIFLINVPLGLAGIWLTWRYAEETARTRSQALDLPGQAAAILALGSLAAATIEGGEHGWTNAWVLGGYAAFVVLLALFLVIERRSTHPMLPLGLFANATFSVTSFAGLLLNVAFYGLIFVFSLYFQRTDHLSPLWTGIAFLPMMVAIMIANMVAAREAALFGPRVAIVGGAIALGLGTVSLLGIGPSTSYLALCVPMIVIGGGLGTLVPPLTSALLGSVEKKRSGVASGVLNSLRQTGSVIGVALFGSLVAASAGFLAGMRIALAISTVLAAFAAAALAVWLRPARA